MSDEPWRKVWLVANNGKKIEVSEEQLEQVMRKCDYRPLIRRIGRLTEFYLHHLCDVTRNSPLVQLHVALDEMKGLGGCAVQDQLGKQWTPSNATLGRIKITPYRGDPSYFVHEDDFVLAAKEMDNPPAWADGCVLNEAQLWDLMSKATKQPSQDLEEELASALRTPSPSFTFSITNDVLSRLKP